MTAPCPHSVNEELSALRNLIRATQVKVRRRDGLYYLWPDRSLKQTANGKEARFPGAIYAKVATILLAVIADRMEFFPIPPKWPNNKKPTWERDAARKIKLGSP